MDVSTQASNADWRAGGSLPRIARAVAVPSRSTSPEPSAKCRSTTLEMGVNPFDAITGSFTFDSAAVDAIAAPTSGVTRRTVLASE